MFIGLTCFICKIHLFRPCNLTINLNQPWASLNKELLFYFLEWLFELAINIPQGCIFPIKNHTLKLTSGFRTTISVVTEFSFLKFSIPVK